MDAGFRTVVRQFGIRQGNLVEGPANISVTETSIASGPRRSRGSLYILLEVLGGFRDPAGVMQGLAKAIGDEYYQGAGSVTGSIVAALRAANERLFEENLNTLREERGVAGVTCAVLRDGELYLGQIGPSLAYLSQADGLRRFPDDSPWLRQAIPSEAERAASPPLGVRRVVEPQIYHAAVQAGDTLLLVSPCLARLASGQAVAEALAQSPAEAGRRLPALTRGEDANVLIVGLEAEAEVPLRPQPRVVPLAREPEPMEDLAEVEPEPVPLRPAPRLRPMRSKRAGLDQAWQVAQRVLASAGRGLAGLMRNVLPDRKPQERRGRAASPRARAQTNSRTVATLAVAIPILVLVVVLVSRWQYARARQQQVAALLQQAAEARASVLNTGQRAEQRDALRKAITFIDQALALAPDEATTLELRRQVLEELDRASVVSRLYTLFPLADLGSADSTTAPDLARIIVRNQDVFVLDRGADRVYHRTLNPTGDALTVPPEAPLVQKGESRGGITVGELVDLLWMPVGGERTAPAIMVAERNGSLLEWDLSQGVSVLPVADSATWKMPQAAGGFNGNFYLLDPQQNRIMKYVATADGYTNPPVDYLLSTTRVDLSGALDMAIDGNIYVLLADGKVLKFLSGEQQPFNLVDLDEPLRNPIAIFVSGQDDAHGYIYIADAGLARVVQFTKQGQFIRQFKAAEGNTALYQLRGLFVDETTQRIYLTSGSRVYAAPMMQGSVPAPSTAPTPTPTVPAG